jgi:hypothetical protein
MQLGFITKGPTPIFYLTLVPLMRNILSETIVSKVTHGKMEFNLADQVRSLCCVLADGQANFHCRNYHQLMMALLVHLEEQLTRIPSKVRKVSQHPNHLQLRCELKYFGIIVMGQTI